MPTLDPPAGRQPTQKDTPTKEGGVTPEQISTLARSVALHGQLIGIHADRALHAAARRLNELDGYPAGKAADSGPVVRSRQSSVERTVALRLGQTNRPGTQQQLDDLQDWLLTASKALREALTVIDRLGAERLDLTDSERKRLRCIGTGDSSGAACHQWGVIRGRCIDCHRAVEAERKRKERMRTEAPA